MYKFEKYYLSLVLYKLFIITNKLLSHALIRYAVLAVVLIVYITIAASVVVYFFIGVNAFLTIIHLEQFRITEIPLLNSTIDLKSFLKK